MTPLQTSLKLEASSISGGLLMHTYRKCVALEGELDSKLGSADGGAGAAGFTASGNEETEAEKIRRKYAQGDSARGQLETTAPLDSFTGLPVSRGVDVTPAGLLSSIFLSYFNVYVEAEDRELSTTAGRALKSETWSASRQHCVPLTKMQKRWMTATACRCLRAAPRCSWASRRASSRCAVAAASAL